MSVHKDKKTGKWYVSCRYDNWDGARKQKMKRGFETNGRYFDRAKANRKQCEY